MWRFRIIIVVCLVVVVGILSFWLSRAEKSVSVPPVAIATPTPQLEIGRPVFSSGAVIAKKPAYTFETSPKPERGSVPIFRVNPAGDPSLVARRLAQSFGKTGNPKIYATSGKTYYSWSDNVNTFSVSGDPVEIAYQTPLAQALPIVTESVGVFGALAQSFLTSKNLIPQGASLSSPIITYYAPVGNDPMQTTADKATVVRLDYRLLLDGRPLYMGSPEVQIFSFRYDSSKTLVSFTGYYFGSFQKGEEVGLVPVETAMSSLYAEGSLVYVFSPEDANDVRTKKYTPGVIMIKDTALGYFYDPGPRSLVPIYVFTGSSKQAKTNKALETVTFFSAVAGQ